MAQESLRHAVIDFIAGSLGGTALVYVGQPFDTVKVKMQTFPRLYNGMVHCFRQTLKNDGVAKGLYAGTVPSVVANVAENSILFAGYGVCQKLVMKLWNIQREEDLSVFHNATAGFFAAFGSSLTLCPTELIKCKLQAMREMQSAESSRNYIGPAKLTRQIIKAEGVGGLFRGLGTTFIREMPGYFFFFGGYEGARELLSRPGQHKDDIGMIRTMAAGAAGGVTFWVAVFPADVVKSRLQVSSVKLNAVQVTLNIFRTEGILAFYNGLLPSIVRTIPATATLFVVYEYSKKYMNSFFE